MWNNIPELCILNILVYTLLCIQVHFSISHPIQRICPSYLMLVNSTCGLFHHFPHFFFTVVAGWAKPQQPGKQSGCTALSGKQEGVWEEGDGHRGAELGGRLSFSTSLLLPLHPPPPHHPSTSVFHFYLVKEEKTQQLYQKNSSATLKKIETTKPEWTLTCLPIHLRKTREGKSILYLCFFFLMHDVK